MAHVFTAQVCVKIPGDVLALAPGAGNRRTGVQNSSDQNGGMGSKKRLFGEKSGRVWPNAELSARVKFTKNMS